MEKSLSVANPQILNNFPKLYKVRNIIALREEMAGYNYLGPFFYYLDCNDVSAKYLVFAWQRYILMQCEGMPDVYKEWLIANAIALLKYETSDYHDFIHLKSHIKRIALFIMLKEKSLTNYDRLVKLYFLQFEKLGMLHLLNMIRLKKWPDQTNNDLFITH